MSGDVIGVGPQGIVMGAVDLDEIDCHGCRWKSKQVCKRFPPVWATAIPVTGPGGKMVGMSQGGWTFPPAVRKCGEFARCEDA